jgi:nucleotide-binding universal stress UspA family protein
MMKTVLVPLDGSELAEEALSYAAPIAERHGSDLHLVFVIHTDATASEDDEAREYLSEISRRIGKETVNHVRIGSAAQEIINISEDLDSPIIVMTTHGRTGIGRWFYGSVADKVVHASSAPVLLLRSGTGKVVVGAINRIVVPLDGSAYSESAIPFAKSMAKTFGAELHIVRVAETANLYSTMGYETYAPGAGQPMAGVVEKMIADIHQYVSETTKKLRDEGFDVQGVVLEGFAGEELLRYENRVNPDLVVMATHGRSGFERFVFGSVAERVLKMGKTPVLMVKPEGDLGDGTSE